MDQKFLRRLSCLACVMVVSVCSVAEAQRFGGGGFRGGGGGARIGGGAIGAAASRPNFSALQSNFGAGSVVHHDFTPNISRPNIPQPVNRPNLSGQTQRNVERPNLAGGGTPRNIDKPNLAGATQKFGPENRGDIFGKGDHNTINRDGPDWKNWRNFSPKNINNTVINKVDVNNQSINTIRNNFNKQYNHNDFFNKNWFDNHPNAWRPGGPPGPGPHPGPGPGPMPPPPPPGWWWGNPGWNHAWGWFTAGFFTGAITDAVLTPIPYAYGSNIVYEGDTVYVNDVPYVGADEYYQQAQDIANAGAVESAPPNGATNSEARPTALAQDDAKPATDAGTQSEWLPMGTFAVVADGKQTESKRILQLATNKQGQIRGNFVNQETDKATELYGSVDPKTQRVAFKVKDNDSIVAECGLWNLTQDTVPMLVHLNKDHTEERTLIRLKDDDFDTKK